MPKFTNDRLVAANDVEAEARWGEIRVVVNASEELAVDTWKERTILAISSQRVSNSN